MHVETTRYLGYTDQLSVEAGKPLTFYVSSDESAVLATVVRFRCADPDANGPGLKYEIISSDLDGIHACQRQETRPGSAIVVAHGKTLVPTDKAAFSIGCYVLPTRPTTDAQTLMGAWCEHTGEGYALQLTKDRGVVLRLGAGHGQAHEISMDVPIEPQRWYWVSASFSPDTGEVRICQHRLEFGCEQEREYTRHHTVSGALLLDAGTPFVIAAHVIDKSEPLRLGGHFDGKIDSPRVQSGPQCTTAATDMRQFERIGNTGTALLAYWDFSVGISTIDVHDKSVNRLDGHLHQLPRRGVTGVNWTGAVHDWRFAPEQYGAIHFHSDDIYDSGWKSGLSFDVPSSWQSGVYGLRLRLPSAQALADEVSVESFIPFFVTPAENAPRKRLAVVLPVVTYLAYANSALRLYAVHFEALTEHLLQLSADDVYLHEHPEIGQSTYDTHIDGSGRCYSSWLRPILNMRPRGTPGNFVIDTHFLDWLAEKQIDFDLITDIDLERRGVRALEPYSVICTLSHPEYYTTSMMNAIMGYQNRGGRHLGLGANSFYWRCAFHPAAPAALEVRRGMCGTRTWESEPGEVNLAGTGEPGALWRHSGFAPQKLVGVGFSAMVYDHAGHYRLTPASRDPRVAFAIEGITEDERIGDFGVRVGGAVGIEIDRYDRELGSPPHAVVLATSHGLGPGALPTPEEFRTMVHGLEGDQNTLVRADAVFFETENGGAVFATGSISYVLSLSWNQYDNNISRLTENVLRRFLDPTAFKMPGLTPETTPAQCDHASKTRES